MYVVKEDLNPILKIRRAEDLTQHQLAEMAGLSRGRIMQVEHGHRAKKVPKKVLHVVERLGYDPVSVQAEYMRWLKEKALTRTESGKKK